MDELGIDFAGYQDHSVNGGKDVLSLGYTEFIAPMIKAIQELSAEVRSLKNEVELIEEVNKLEWVNINDNFFDMNRYAGEGNIGHIIEEIKIDLKATNK